MQYDTGPNTETSHSTLAFKCYIYIYIYTYNL